MRRLVLGLAVLLALAGTALWWSGASGTGLWTLAALIVIGTLFDRTYRGRADGPGAQWERTGEREIDHATGELLEVWYDPASGARRYQSLGKDPG